MMNPGDNEAGKRNVGPFSRKPLIRYPAGSPDFNPGPRAVQVTQQISSQVFSFPWSAASPMLLPLWTSSASSFRDSLSTWSPSPSSSLESLSRPSPSLLLSGTDSVVVEETRDFSIGFNENPSFQPPRPNSMSVSGKTVSPRGRHRRAEENGNDMIQTNLAVKRKAENNINTFPKSHKRS